MRSLPLAACLLALSCSASRADLERSVGGPQVLSVIEAPVEVRAWRLEGEDSPRFDTAKPDDYAAAEGPIEPGEELTGRLVTLLSDPGSYLFDGTVKACIPYYNVRLELRAGSERVDLFLCTSCYFLLAYRNGAYCGSLQFDPAAEEIVSALLDLFPKDQRLRHRVELLRRR